MVIDLNISTSLKNEEDDAIYAALLIWSNKVAQSAPLIKRYDADCLLVRVGYSNKATGYAEDR